MPETPDAGRWSSMQQFLFHEARLLDERRWDEWLNLLTDDVTYWVPYQWGQESATDHVSIFYEDKTLLKMRIDRLENELSPLEWPPSRTNHHITNFQIDADDGDTATVKALFLFVEYRRGEQRTFSARGTWPLQQDLDGYRINAKRVDLLNCDQEIGHLRISVPI